MTETNIEWADRVWNPVTGCTKVSQGCKNCYAEGVANRFWGGRKFTDVQTHADRLDAPLRWRKPARIFVNSMSDLFHEDVPDEFIDRVFAVMALARQHAFLALTKRPARMREYMTMPGLSKRIAERMIADHERLLIKRREILPGNGFGLGGLRVWPLPNVHLGVSVENQQTADERIPLLLQTPAVVRWVSYEPALGPIDFTAIHYTDEDTECVWNALTGEHEVLNSTSPDCVTTAEDGNTRLDWIVVGGESGPRARPFDIAWARQTVQQSKAAGVPVFVKQLGADPRDPHWDMGGMVTLRDSKGGDPSEWPEDLRVREWPPRESGRTRHD